MMSAGGIGSVCVAPFTSFPGQTFCGSDYADPVCDRPGWWKCDNGHVFFGNDVELWELQQREQRRPCVVVSDDEMPVVSA